MKRMILAALIGLGVLSIAGSAMAAGSTNIAVSASVPTKCAVDTAPGTLTAVFGDVTLGPAPITVSALFRCTKGTVYTVAGDAGLHGGTAGSFGNMNDGGVNNIKYTYANPAGGVGLGWGMGNQMSTSIILTLDSTTANAAPVGTYTDTLILTVSP